MLIEGLTAVHAGDYGKGLVDAELHGLELALLPFLEVLQQGLNVRLRIVSHHAVRLPCMQPTAYGPCIFRHSVLSVSGLVAKSNQQLSVSLW